MSLLGKLFGTEKALTSVINSVSNGLDKLVYTEKEREEDAATDRSEARRMVVCWMEKTQGQNLARRIIALSITAVWLSMYLISILFSMGAIFVGGSDASMMLTEVGAIAKDSVDDLNSPIMLILAFYFAAPHMGEVAKAVTSRMTDKINRDKKG